MGVGLNSLLELALQVPQSILRCGHGLIHGRVNMMRLLAHVCNGQVFNYQMNIIPYKSFL